MLNKFTTEKRRKKQAQLHFLSSCFKRFCHATIEIFEKDQKHIKTFQNNWLKKKYFKRLEKYSAFKQDKTNKTGVAYLHIKDKLLKKYFDILKPIYFKKLKRK